MKIERGDRKITTAEWAFAVFGVGFGVCAGVIAGALGAAL